MTASPYAPLTPSPPALPDYRVTAYYYAAQHGLPVTFGYLLELGLRAARLGRWHGLAELRVTEDPYGLIGPVHTWPEWVFAEAAAGLEGVAENPVQPWSSYGRQEPGHGYWEAGDYGEIP